MFQDWLLVYIELHSIWKSLDAFVILMPPSWTDSTAPDVCPIWQRTAALLTRMPPQAIEPPTLLVPMLVTLESQTAFVLMPGTALLLQRAALLSVPVTFNLKLSIAPKELTATIRVTT